MFSLRTHVVISAVLLALLILIPVVGNVVSPAGVQVLGPFTRVFQVFYLGIFVAFGLSTIPVIVKTVLGAQVRLGNQDKAPVAAALRHQNRIIWVMLGLIVAGSAIAIPAMILDGGFDTATKGTPPDLGPSLGTLRAAPNMAIADVIRQSSVTVKPTSPGVPLAGAGNFDFEIPGSGMRFANCRYYFMSSFSDNQSRVEGMSVGTSPVAATFGEIGKQNAMLRSRLDADGWETGHEVYRSEDDQVLHGGAKEGPDGDTWRKNGVVLDIRSRRMDDPAPGEDGRTGGKWIQYVELWAERTSPGIERFEFARWHGRSSPAP
jgi:hypothetical protein